MKSIFVPVGYKGSLTLDIKKVNSKIKIGEINLPKKIGVLTTVQFLDRKKEILEFLNKSFPKIDFEFKGQILGCNVLNAEKDKNSDGFLYVGTGDFHPLKIKYDTKKDVFVWNPFSGEISKINQKELKKFENRKRLGIVKFLNAKKVGIIVTTKPGQQNLIVAKDIEDKIKKRYPEKEVFIFIWDNINITEFDNFNFIDCWVNTACPRFQDDFKGIMNASDFYELLTN